jgi:WD40 repeat protein
LDRSEKCIITAGVDGYIRWWDFASIDSAEVDSDHSMDFELIPITSYFIGKDVGIKCMIDSGRNELSRCFVILDTKGNMQTISFSFNSNKAESIKLRTALATFNDTSPHPNQIEEQSDLKSFNVEQKTFNKFHAATITGMDTCPNDHLVATCSVDGSVRCMNYLTKSEIAVKFFSTAATCLKWFPLSLDSSGKYIVVGFADGVIRILGIGGRGSDGKFSLIRKMAFKPHNASVIDLSFNADGSALATSGKDGIIFFFACSSSVTVSDDATDYLLEKIIPIKFCNVVLNIVENTAYKNIISCERLVFNQNGSTLLCTCSDGVLREINVNELKALNSLKNLLRQEETIEQTFRIICKLKLESVINESFELLIFLSL